MRALTPSFETSSILPPKQMMFVTRDLRLDAHSQQKSQVKWTSPCVKPNAKPLKLFYPQSHPKMPSDIHAKCGSMPSVRCVR
jgi:hypothetical protein